MIDVFFVDEWVTLATTALMPSVIAVMNLATLHRTVPTRFLPQEHHTTKTDLFQGIDIPTPVGTDHTPPIMVPYMGDILAGHSPKDIPTVTETAVWEGTHLTPHLATPSSSCCPLANRFPYHLSCHDTNLHSLTPSPTHHFCRHHSHHSTDQNQSCFSNSHHTTQEKAKPCLKPSTIHKPYHSKMVTIQNSPSDSSSNLYRDTDPLNY